MAGKKILLIEPSYKNKYPPLGLMKIAQYHGPSNKNDFVKFIKGEDISVLGHKWDRIYITTLFSFEWPKISKSIDFALHAAWGNPSKIFVGGIASSLMNERFTSNPFWKGIRFIRGLLKDSPARSLMLGDGMDDFYSDDDTGDPIEDLTPDYSILDQIDYRYPVRDAYFAYASRGCIRSCKFCGVPKLEGEQRDTYSVSRVVNEVSRLYGEKKDLMLMDNNVVASSRFKDIISEIIDCGFGSGETLYRDGKTTKRRVDFNQGVDARILSKDPMYLQELSKICINPLRIAFDHLGLKKPYEKSIRYSADVGLKYLSNYMLYNFHDGPDDLFERMRMNVDLNEELGLRIFSFPMRYAPTDQPNRDHVGPKWNKYHLRSIRTILQATHGIVSGNPTFFKFAFGDSVSEFMSILNMPHKYILNRRWYNEFGGRPEFDEFQSDYNNLSENQKSDLLCFISSRPGSVITKSLNDISDRKIRNVARYYQPLSHFEEKRLWDRMKIIKQGHDIIIPEDELVEDAQMSFEFGS